MAQKRRDYRRFWAVFNRLTIRGDREECRRQIVSQYTAGRTDSLREMTEAEYDDCVAGMQRLVSDVAELKKKRSACLRLMQQLGVDTTDWDKVDAFCGDSRIAGRRFAHLDIPALGELQRKLHSIRCKGGLSRRTAQTGDTRCRVTIIPGAMAKA